MTTETMSKTEIKKKTKDTIETLFKDKGLVAIERSAGAVKYKAIRFDESSQNNVACIYGARNVGASIWVKDIVFQQLKDNGVVTASSHNVEDVSFFKRGVDWKIDIVDYNDPVIERIVATCVVTHRKDYEAEVLRNEDKAKRQAAAEARKAEMDAKRKSPF
tara:strand:- start:1056 stop:1538 length:483 start_codon:yes stop_codon:yes gene_type:complete